MMLEYMPKEGWYRYWPLRGSHQKHSTAQDAGCEVSGVESRGISGRESVLRLLDDLSASHTPAAGPGCVSPRQPSADPPPTTTLQREQPRLSQRTLLS